MFKLLRKVTFLSLIAVVLALILAPTNPHFPASHPDVWDFGFPVRHRFFNVNGIRLHVLDTAAENDTRNDSVMLFLHGFPQFSGMWWKHLQYFSSNGHRCVALDQRGYYVSEKPAGVAAYEMSNVPLFCNQACGADMGS